MRKKDETKHSLYINPIAMLIIAIVGILMTALIFYFTYLTFTTTKGTIPTDNIASPPGLVKGDWLSFWGCIFSALCTIVLACFALVQNVNLSKINDQKEKTDIFFAELRFSAEFFSQIEFENIYLKRQGVEVPALEFEIKSIGKCPPSSVDVKHFSISRRPLQNNFEIEGKEGFELYSLRKTTASSVLRKTKLAERTSIQLFSISIPIRVDEIDDFMEKYNYSEGLKSDSEESSITAQIELTLTNPLEVETYFLGELTLRFKPRWFNSNRKIEGQEEIMFNVLDSSIETLVYKYIGHLIS